MFVTVGLSCAVVCAVYAIFFGKVEHFSTSLFTAHPLLLFVLSPLGLLASFFLVRLLAPGSSGSGIPQVMVCIEKSHEHLSTIFLNKIMIGVKILSSLLGVFAGAAIGREGPSLQIAASVAHNLGGIFRRFNIIVKTEQLLIAGAASGLAAAFNTPIGGIVYAIEELSREHVRTFKGALLLSVVFSGLTAQLINGNYLYLGYPSVLKNIGVSSFFAIVSVSLVCGVIGSLFSKVLNRLILWRMSKTLQTQVIVLILIGFLFAGTFYFFGPRYLYSGKESINQVLFTFDSIPLSECFARVFMPAISSMTGIAGGVFAPSLSAGAILGGFASEFMDPSLRTILALSGMVAFLTGVTHTPITSFILVLEMTDRHGAVFPMMIAAIFSLVGAHLVSKTSFYEMTVENIKKAHP